MVIKELSTDIVMYEIFRSSGTVHRHAKRTVHGPGYVWNLLCSGAVHRHAKTTVHRHGYLWNSSKFRNSPKTC